MNFIEFIILYLSCSAVRCTFNLFLDGFCENIYVVGAAELREAVGQSVNVALELSPVNAIDHF